jgi:hypothetical protein
MKYPAPGRLVRLSWNPIRTATVKRVILEEDLTVSLHVAWYVAWGDGGEDTLPADQFEPVDETGGWVEIMVTAGTP